MEHILSLSYGKDSLACLGAIEELGWTLDHIVHAEVWATDTIPADLPPMVEFKKKADAIIKERWGIEVEHISAGVSYESVFYRRFSKGKNRSRIYGWPFQRGPWCNSRLKRGVLDKIGIAADETERAERMTEQKKSPLVEAGWTEAMCRDWCEKNDLLSPIYTTATRGGCWFCHNQSANQLRLLRKNYPEYWALMLKWDKDSPVTFHADGRTVHDFERRFQLEDEGLISADDKVFRWNTLDSELNYREAEEVATYELPNAPLTLSELREMDGEPVYDAYGACYIVNLKNGYAADKYRGFKMLWSEESFYRRKPEEGENGSA